jgi:hypothetical protein
MTGSPLTPFWIVPPSKHGPLGFGVTAFSFADALRIIEEAGYELSDDRATLRVMAGIRTVDLDQFHVVPNMGPIVVRGLWYPFTRVGV